MSVAAGPRKSRVSHTAAASAGSAAAKRTQHDGGMGLDPRATRELESMYDKVCRHRHSEGLGGPGSRSNALWRALHSPAAYGSTCPCASAAASTCRWCFCRTQAMAESEARALGREPSARAPAAWSVPAKSAPQPVASSLLPAIPVVAAASSSSDGCGRTTPLPGPSSPTQALPGLLHSRPGGVGGAIPSTCGSRVGSPMADGAATLVGPAAASGGRRHIAPAQQHSHLQPTAPARGPMDAVVHVYMQDDTSITRQPRRKTLLTRGTRDAGQGDL